MRALHRGGPPELPAGHVMGDAALSCAESVAAVCTALVRYGLLLKQDKVVPSVVGIVTGESLRTSWWSHPKARLIFSVLAELGGHPQVLVTKILQRKDTLVHASLWPALLTVAGARDPWQVRGLSTAAVDLLRRIDRAGSPVRATGLAVKELELRLLCAAHEVHAASGRHEIVLESWQAWSARTKCTALVSSAGAREMLEQAAANLGASLAGLPWRKR